jgi:hypothetical protein
MEYQIKREKERILSEVRYQFSRDHGLDLHSGQSKHYKMAFAVSLLISKE